MRKETQEIVSQVEQLSGAPVQILAVPSLPVVGTTSTPLDPTQGYLIQYRQGIPFKDYVVAFQCGHILRVLALPTEQRFQFATGKAASEWATKLVRSFLERPGKSTPPPPRDPKNLH